VKETIVLACFHIMENYSAEYYTLCETERRLHLGLDRSKLQPRRYFLGKHCKDLEVAFQRRGWVPGSAADADFLWVRSRERPASLKPGVFVNHVGGVQSLTAKSLLVSCLRHSPKAALFFPRSFALPDGFTAFTRNFGLTQTYCRAVALLEQQGVAGAEDLKTLNEGRVLLGLSTWSAVDATTANLVSLRDNLLKEVQSAIEGSGCVWILKPGRKSRGRGITLHRSLRSIQAAVRAGHSYVLQKYIERPLLIDGRKFDLRVWTVVVGEEAQIWVYDHCYARFSVQSYTQTDLENCYVHLTNNSVSKWAKDFESSSIPGCMWSLRQLRTHLRSRFYSGVWTVHLWPQIIEIVQHTIRTATLQPRETAFELLGFDLLVTQDLEVWLLEVNSSPSLQHSTAVTAHLVPRMLDDLLTLVLGQAPKHFHLL